MIRKRGLIVKKISCFGWLGAERLGRVGLVASEGRSTNRNGEELLWVCSEQLAQHLCSWLVSSSCGLLQLLH
jgi:hypothetical protein